MSFRPVVCVIAEAYHGDAKQLWSICQWVLNALIILVYGAIWVVIRRKAGEFHFDATVKSKQRSFAQLKSCTVCRTPSRVPCEKCEALAIWSHLNSLRKIIRAMTSQKWRSENPNLEGPMRLGWAKILTAKKSPLVPSYL